MKTADIITYFRILSIIPITILIINDFKVFALIIYFLAIISDLLDGIVARITKTQSLKGAILDGLADSLFGMFILLWSYVLIPQVWHEHHIIILSATIIYLISIIISYFLTKKIFTPHKPLGKLATFLLLTSFPILVIFSVNTIIIYVVAITIILSRLEIILLAYRVRK